MDGEKRPRGRPKDDRKRVAVLTAARALFLSQGPDVTLDEVSAAAGVSKANLYANFGDKEGLIEAVIRREAEATILDEEFLSLKKADLGDALFSFGVRYLTFINSRDVFGWDRLIASVVHRSELAQRFFDLGPGHAQRLLQDFIEDAARQGKLIVVDAEQAADELTGLWLGFANLAIKLGVRRPFTPPEIEKRVVRSIAIFLSIYEPELANKAAAGCGHPAPG